MLHDFKTDCVAQLKSLAGDTYKINDMGDEVIIKTPTKNSLYEKTIAEVREPEKAKTMELEYEEMYRGLKVGNHWETQMKRGNNWIKF